MGNLLRELDYTIISESNDSNQAIDISKTSAKFMKKVRTTISELTNKFGINADGLS